jgi:hypothetical protein
MLRAPLVVALVELVVVPGVVLVAELEVPAAPAPYPLPLLDRSNCQGTATSLPMLAPAVEARLEMSEPGVVVAEGDRWGSVAEREVSVVVDVSRSVVLVPGVVVAAPGVVALDAPLALDRESNANWIRPD